MNKIDLAGKSAIVTGGADGIGRAISERLLASGANVVMWDISQENLDRAQAEIDGGDGLSGEIIDVTDVAQVGEQAKAAIARHGKIDIMVNNAGITGPAKKSWEYSAEEWLAVINLDLNAVFYCCQALMPHMMANGYGRIVNIASIAGKEGNPRMVPYSATKAAVIGLTKSVGKELAGTGIRVNCVTPAVIQTRILDQLTPAQVDYMLERIPMGRTGEVSEVAALVAWLASKECSFSTGAVFDISGGRATY